MTIIFEINRRFLRDVSVRFLNNEDRIRRMSIIEETDEKKVQMAHLAIVGSHSVNGVAKLHSRLLIEQELKGFHEMFPDRFNNKTNGITPRRWLLASNFGLTKLISIHIGCQWPKDLEQLRKLIPFPMTRAFDRILAWSSIKIKKSWPKS